MAPYKRAETCSCEICCEIFFNNNSLIESCVSLCILYIYILNTTGMLHLKIITSSEVIKFATYTILITTKILYDFSYLDDAQLFIL